MFEEVEKVDERKEGRDRRQKTRLLGSTETLKMRLEMKFVEVPADRVCG